MPGFSNRSLPRNDTTCPTCDARAEEGQLVCLECGSRVALDYRRPPSWRVPLAIVAGVLLLAIAATAFALKSIGDDAEREASRTPVKVKDGKRPASGEAGKKTSKPPVEKKAATEGAAGSATSLVRRGALYSWPPDLRAFTVVLLSTDDRASADSFARSASEGRPAKIGVIRADDFESLPKGLFVVFAGQYENRDAAERAADRLEPRFSGSVPQLVEG